MDVCHNGGGYPGIFRYLQIRKVTQNHFQAFCYRAQRSQTYRREKVSQVFGPINEVELPALLAARGLAPAPAAAPRAIFGRPQTRSQTHVA